MSTLENYQDKKRSGLYDDTTTAQDIVEPVRPEQPVRQERVVLPDHSAQTRDTVRVMYADVVKLEKSVKTLRWLSICAIAISLLALIVSLYSLTNKPTRTVRVEIEKPIYKTKVKKVIVASRKDHWRKKLCYGYGDWNACLAYKKGLPFRARVGRSDL